MRGLLFLDIDGVLNDHTKFNNSYCGIDRQKMELLNQIVTATGCEIVLVSAWRYMILKRAMTLEGFRYLLAINGAHPDVLTGLIGTIEVDGNPNDPHDRALLVDKWLCLNGRPMSQDRKDVVVLDDSDCGYAILGLNHVMPKSDVGLTEWERDKVISLLGPVNVDPPKLETPTHQLKVVE